MKYLNDISYKDCVGKVFKSLNSGDFKVLKYNDSKNKGKKECLGSFNTELEAFDAYKQAKEIFIKEQAEKWKSQIDIRAYNALMKYEVEITD